MQNKWSPAECAVGSQFAQFALQMAELQDECHETTVPRRLDSHEFCKRLGVSEDLRQGQMVAGNCRARTVVRASRFGAFAIRLSIKLTPYSPYTRVSG